MKINVYIKIGYENLFSAGYPKGSGTGDEGYASDPEGDALALASIESASAMSGLVDLPTADPELHSYWMSLQDGTVVAEGLDAKDEVYVCMRVTSSTGHILAWQPIGYAADAALLEFHTAMADDEYGAHSFDAVALMCLHVAPARTRPDLSSLTPSLPARQALRAPLALGQYVPDQLLGHAKAGSGWHMHAQFSYGEPEWVNRSTLAGTPALAAYDAEHPFPYAEDRWPAPAQPPPPDAPRPTPTEAPAEQPPPPPAQPAEGAAQAVPPAHAERIDAIEAQLQLLSSSIMHQRDAMAANVSATTLKAERAAASAQEALSTAETATTTAQQLNAMLRELEARVLALEQRPCSSCQALASRVQLLEQAQAQRQPAQAQPGPQPGMSAAQRMMHAHKQREREAAAAKEHIRLATNAAELWCCWQHSRLAIRTAPHTG